MKTQKNDRPFRRTSLLLAIAMASALVTYSAFASEPESVKGELDSMMTGLSKEQQQKVAKAREEQLAKRYNEKEQQAIDLAILTVNEQTPVSKDSVSHVRIRSTQWPDSSLGCAEPGVEYLQRMIPGYFVSFTANEKIFTVHTGEGTAIVCDRFNDMMAERQKRGMAVIKAQKAARIDLATKLMVDPEEINVTKIKTVTWTDASLGCPVEGQQYKQEPTEGLVISMTCRERQYEYRVTLGGKDFISCKDIVSCHETE